MANRFDKLLDLICEFYKMNERQRDEIHGRIVTLRQCKELTGYLKAFATADMIPSAEFVVALARKIAE